MLGQACEIKTVPFLKHKDLSGSQVPIANT